MPNNIDRYDNIKQKHTHFICYKCHKVIDLFDEYLKLSPNIGKNKVIDYELNFKGICEDCMEGEVKNELKRK